MLPSLPNRLSWASALRTLCVAVLISAPAIALDSFRSIDNRLPNPDRPYDMTGPTVHFQSSPHFALYDLQFQPKNLSQLDYPTLINGAWEFDSTFDISYRAVISISTQPAYTVNGFGKARAVGVAPAGANPQVFDAELVALNLYALSPIPEVMFRESPTLRSSGVITREDICPPCASIFTRWRISSFFDVFAEVSLNGGNTWTPGERAIHIEQVTDPVADSDFNGDGVVDGADYIAWRRGNGTEYSSTDYNLWRANFGASTSTGTATGLPDSVPEPSTAFLVTAAAFGLLCQLSHWRTQY